MRLNAIELPSQTEAKGEGDQLADALGVTETTVRNWEAGQAIPKLTPVQYKKLLAILQITSDELLDQFGFPEGQDD